MTKSLRNTAQALLANWDTPEWNKLSKRAELMAELRAALVAPSPVSSPGPTEDDLAAAFQDGFTNGNAAWEETPDYHKNMFREGVRCILAVLNPTPAPRLAGTREASTIGEEAAKIVANLRPND